MTVGQAHTEALCQNKHSPRPDGLCLLFGHHRFSGRMGPSVHICGCAGVMLIQSVCAIHGSAVT